MINKLYVNVAGWSQLDISFDIDEIVTTMKLDNKKYKHTHYLVVQEERNEAPKWETLRSQEEIDNYIAMHNERKRLDDMSCVELKSDIVKNVKVKKIGSRKN